MTSGMKLQLLGTGGYHPSERRQTACFMLPEVGVMLDAGTAMFRAREHIATDALDIFLSHAHLDHVVGLSFLLDVLWEKPVSRVTIHGSPATLSAVCGHLFAPALFPVAPSWEFRELADEIALPGGGILTHFPLPHPGGSTGYRLDWRETSMAYVTDTTATSTADYARLIEGVNLLVHECYFDDSRREFAQLTGHSCTATWRLVAGPKSGVWRWCMSIRSTNAKTRLAWKPPEGFFRERIWPPTAWKSNSETKSPPWRRWAWRSRPGRRSPLQLPI